MIGPYAPVGRALESQSIGLPANWANSHINGLLPEKRLWQFDLMGRKSEPAFL